MLEGRMMYPKAFMSKSRISSINKEVEEMLLSVGRGSLSIPSVLHCKLFVHVKRIPTPPDTALTCPEREASLRKEVHMCPLMVSAGHCSLLQSHL